MPKGFLATTALAALLASGALAQDTADPAQVPETSEHPQSLQDDSMGHDTDVAEDPADVTDAEAAKDPAAAAGAETAQQPVSDAPTSEAPASDVEPAAGTGTEMAQQPASDAPTTAAERELTPVAASDISAEALIGTEIETPEAETIASVNDVLLDADGKVENIVAEFGGFLGFGTGTVLLTMDEVEIFRDADDSLVVQTTLTPETLEGRPEYEAEEPAG